MELAGLPAALDRLNAARRPAAPWLLADFRPARQGWRHLLLAAMYWFFGLATGLRARTLPDLVAALQVRGLQPGMRQHFFAGATEAVVLR